jgi:hypothetical protein
MLAYIGQSVVGNFMTLIAFVASVNFVTAFVDFMSDMQHWSGLENVLHGQLWVPCVVREDVILSTDRRMSSVWRCCHTRLVSGRTCDGIAGMRTDRKQQLNVLQYSQQSSCAAVHSFDEWTGSTLRHSSTLWVICRKFLLHTRTRAGARPRIWTPVLRICAFCWTLTIELFDVERVSYAILCWLKRLFNVSGPPICGQC